MNAETDDANAPSVILFDLGNVLFCDPWESLLLTPGSGLADRWGLDPSFVREAGRRLWNRFSVRESEEAQYWQALSQELDRPVPPELVADLEDELLVANPAAGELLAAASHDGRRPVGIASNNTTFWYAKQAERLGLARWVDPGLVFLSCRLGVTKGTPGHGLLEVVAEHTRPPDTLLVEDRPANLARARSLGFRAVCYAFTDPAGVSSAELLDTITG
ncbi:hypothetical protein [Streptomyces sp. NPDC005538]|uniref:HAD family hydrolase n=1 Tax=unclassified Streptomyces TaxID=2593676 RepID=UPI0033AF4FD8